MPYRRYSRYGSRPYTDWSKWHESRRDAVTRTFGGIDKDVTQAFFSLSPSKLDEVFALYESSYGRPAAQYARASYRKWRTGNVQASGQTLLRLLEVVPYALSFEAKTQLYRKLRDANRTKEAVVLKVATADDLNFVEATVNRIVDRAKSQPLPPIVDSRLVWLSGGDGLVARALVAASEEADGRTVAEALRLELPTLQRLFSETERNHHMQHEISLPCGTVTVKFTRAKKRRWFMSSEEETEKANLPARREDRPAKDIFEFALQSMINPDDSQEIVLAAQREYLRLQTKKVEGEIDAEGAERELRQFIEQIREASGLQNVSVEASADFKRASGTTRMTVKKKSRWWPFG